MTPVQAQARDAILPRTAGARSDGESVALQGGPKSVTLPDTTTWPVITDADRAAVMEVLEGGALVSDRNEVTAVETLERRFASYVGARHCVAVSNGTVALQLALSALGIGPGDEVIVPALSFVATAMAVVHQGARPVFADIDPDTFNLDPVSVGACLSERTAAVMPVHLHGLPADMNGIATTLDTSNAASEVTVVEDAAQAHGATLNGQHVGTFGSIGSFSLQATKNLPTCGEGGLLVTDDPDLARGLLRLRQFGEDIERGRPRSYVSHQIGYNAKLSSVQAAFTSSQLDRLDTVMAAQDLNVKAFLARLDALPGLKIPDPGSLDVRHVWHILRFRLDPRAAGLEPSHAAPFASAVLRLLRSEGVPLTRYQLMPLPDQPAFAHLFDAERDAVPVTRAVLADSFVLQRRHLDPAAGPLLQQYADAFEKVWTHLDVAVALTRAAVR